MKYSQRPIVSLWHYPMPKYCEKPPLPERYGNRKVPKMLAEISTLRQLIRAQGTEEIQAAWDRIEAYIDFLLQEVARSE